MQKASVLKAMSTPCSTWERDSEERNRAKQGERLGQ